MKKAIKKSEGRFAWGMGKGEGKKLKTKKIRDSHAGTDPSAKSEKIKTAQGHGRTIKFN